MTLADDRATVPTLLTGRHLVLDDTTACLAVVAGEVVLFAVRRDAPAARQPIGRIPAGGLLFGLPPSRLGNEVMLAVANADARLYGLPPEGWPQTDPSDAFADGLALWLQALSDGLAPAFGPRPLSDLVAADGVSVPLAAEAVVGGSGGIIWIDLPPGGARLFGIEPVGGFLPLPTGAWLVLDEPGEVRALDWRSGLARPDWPTGLAVFDAAVAELLPLARGLAEVDEAHRLRRRHNEEAFDTAQAAGRIADILGNRLPLRAEGGGDGLLDVMRVLGRALGTPVRRPTRGRRAQMDMPPTLEEIARASDLRLQPVRLADDWWRTESAPMLAWRDGRTPVALVWRGAGWCETDHTGTERPVTAANAAGVTVEAHAVFRPLPLRPDVLALLSTGVAGGGADLLVFLAALLVGSVLAQALPVASGFVYGVLVPTALPDAVMQVGALMLLIGVAGFVAQLAGEAARRRFAARADSQVHDGVWDRIVGLPLGVLRGWPSADLAARAAAAVSVAAGVRHFLFTAVGALGVVLSSLVVIAWNDAVLAGLAASLVALHLAVGFLAGWLQVRAMLDGERLLGSADSLLAEFVNGIVALRGAAAEGRALLRWTDCFASLRARLVASRRMANAYEAWQAAYPGFATAVLFAAIHATSATPEGTASLPVATAVVVLTSFALMLAGVSQLLRGGLAVWLLRSGWAYAKPLLQETPEALADLTDPGPLIGAIEFSSVGFAYGDGPTVLSDVSFRAVPGDMIAIVGPSGCGKSTLVRLLLGLEAPSHGAVYVDGHDTRALHPDALRRRIGVVLQDSRLPPGTIFEIVRGLTDATPKQVWEALAAAAMAEDVAAMPMGLHTLLPDASRTLSGGQVQRLVLAGALLAKPAVLVLDEATSALDNNAQARVMEAVRRVPATRIVIAHRLSTIRHANRILVLDGGRVVESGGFDELMNRRGHLYRLVKRQEFPGMDPASQPE
ncbi:ATP-binding cassette domain-containing protein [Azospirillum griseum]|uniref:ATP-binding cassette domain-containing protein n=1 Tax=Azospirillum griseum TaxID=2496639 RepID=A0A431VJY9_9PROT|nr:ATP-binding cassette domain-containing protein [Azospirillum griseum]